MESPEKAGAEAKHPRKTRSRLIVLAVIIVPVLAVVGPRIWRYAAGRVEYATKAPTFSGSSDGLKQTLIVPTLDTPMPPGRNVIWCSSFQLAWNEVRDKVIGAPLAVPDAAEIAARLNAATQSVSDLDAKSVYAAGGRIKDGVRERIGKDMAAKFPSHAVPDVSAYTDGILAYSYLIAQVPFKYPFRRIEKGLAFTDSYGTQTRVTGFGLWKAYLRPFENIREQVRVLHAGRDASDSERLTECALDLCCHSTPYQIVVARVTPMGSLGKTLEYLRTQMASFEKPPYYEQDRRFGGNDELRIPEMFWRLDHRFKELIGRAVANCSPPMPIVEALQTIEFRLDRSGVVLDSDSMLAVAAAPRHFEFDRPFLVYMKKRDAEQPFLVMWVDNAELLTRR